MLKIPKKTAQKVRCGANFPCLHDLDEPDEVKRFKKHHAALSLQCERGLPIIT